MSERLKQIEHEHTLRMGVIGKHAADRELYAALERAEESLTEAQQRIQALEQAREQRLRVELEGYLDTLTITSDTIGDIRRSLLMPWDSAWNGVVRDETAKRERKA